MNGKEGRMNVWAAITVEDQSGSLYKQSPDEDLFDTNALPTKQNDASLECCHREDRGVRTGHTRSGVVPTTGFTREPRDWTKGHWDPAGGCFLPRLQGWKADESRIAMICERLSKTVRSNSCHSQSC